MTFPPGARLINPDVEAARLADERVPPQTVMARLGREWSEIRPGVQGRLRSFGGVNDDAFAVIETRQAP